MEGKRRVCHIQRGDSGFGFILCCENATTDTYVLHVLKSSPASRAKLSPGDRIIEVNGLNVEREPHKEVVERLQGLQSVKLIVAHSRAAEEYFKTPGNGMTVKPLDDANELRPKLVTVTRTSSGFDFVLQTVGKSPKMSTGKYRQQLKGIAGHYVGTLDRDGVAYKAGLRQGHRLIEINETSIEQESHSYVIAVIRASHTVRLLVVDEDTDEFFLRHGISPSAKHLDGKLELGTFPSPILEGKPIERTRPFISSPMPYYDVTRSPSSLSDIALMRKMAMSTPDLSTFGKSTSQSPGFGNPSNPNRKERSKVKKRFSLFDKKKKSGFYKSSVDLASGRKLYDETIISDSESSKGSSPAPILEQPDIVNDVTRRN
uniref:PDZ domain-containing protein n=2 Tax=Ciona intestinalis TaxID=7719 RepID=F6S6P6_CIOIN